MALAREIMGSSLMEKSPFLSSSSRMALSHKRSMFFLPFEGRKVQHHQGMRRRGFKSTTPVAAISEDLDLDLVKVVPEKAVRFKVRAVVTVRNKNKEDFKDALVKHLDSLTDKIGRNVVLELISSDFDPSKHFSLTVCVCLFIYIFSIKICD